MSTYPPHVWNQLKGITSQKLIKALKQDGWKLQVKKGRQGKKGANTLSLRHPDKPTNRNRIVIHPHPKKTMSPNLLEKLLDDTGWVEEDFIRLRLIRRTR